jgi:2-polyprenyl-6-methoxyphenol hydroxylase-like FAD-dependent oxidoreductase
VLSREFNACSDIETRWREFCAVDPRIGEVVGERRFPEDFVRIRRDWGHARRYGNAGAFLLGDAAHPVSPAGGQGANMSVADARVLAELILQGSTGALSEYEGRRRTANSRSLRFTRLASFGSSMAPSLTRIASLFRVLDGVRRRPAAIRALLHMASTAFLEKEYRRRDDPTG